MRKHTWLRIIIRLIVFGLIIAYFTGCSYVEESASESGAYVEEVLAETNEVEKDHEVKLEELGNAIAGKISLYKTWENTLTDEEKEAVTYFDMSENGEGLLLVEYFCGGDLTSYTNVYYSDDGGSEWRKMNQEPYCFAEVREVIRLNNNVMIYSNHGNSRMGYWNVMHVSHDNGESFEETDPYDMAQVQHTEEFSMDIQVDEVGVENGMIILSWKPGLRESQEIFFTAKYNLNMKFQEEIYRNEIFYDFLDWVQGEKKHVFTDSDRRYLSAEEVEDYLDACAVYDAAHPGNDTAEKFLSQEITEIYIRKGYNSNDDMENVAKRFSVYEQHNVDLLAEIRKERGL